MHRSQQLHHNESRLTTASLDQFIINCVVGGTACGSQSLAGLNIFLNIAQTDPTVGNTIMSGGVMTGSISGTASTASITWSAPNTVNIGAISYSIQSNPLSLLPPAQDRVNPVTALIVDTSAPEPTT